MQLLENKIGAFNLFQSILASTYTGNDRRVTPILEEINEEEFRSHIKKETSVPAHVKEYLEGIYTPHE